MFLLPIFMHLSMELLWGGGMQARGGDLMAKSISSVGGLIKHLCLGVQTFGLVLMLLLFLLCICISHIMLSDNKRSSCLLKSSLRNSQLKSQVQSIFCKNSDLLSHAFQTFSLFKFLFIVTVAGMMFWITSSCQIMEIV